LCFNGGDVRTHRYRITICGGLGEADREALGDLRIESSGMNTVLTGDLDQAALHGVLNRIRALGIELAEVSRLPEGTEPSGAAHISSEPLSSI
jgi:hypothetical protein